MKASWFQPAWRRAVVYGLGVSGVAAAKLLRRYDVEVIGYDQRDAAELALGRLAEDRGVRVVAGGEPERLPHGVDGVVVSPGVALDRPILAEARRRGLPVIGEVELAAATIDGTLIGITGSNGKSTTTALTGELLRRAGRKVEVVGNIGVPLADRAVDDADRIYVAELSSFQLESIVDLRPAAAAWLNLSDDHLDRHGDASAYAAAKRRLFANQETDDVAILNGDDARVASIPVASRRRLFSRSAPVEDGCYLDGDRVVEVAPGEPELELFRAGEIGLSGVHNLENAMAAALLARACGVGPAELKPGLAEFRGLPHRLQSVATVGDVEWFDDSKGTNVGATARSLEGFAPDHVHLILGGRAKGGGFEALRRPIARACRSVYLIGEAAAELETALDGVVPIIQAEDLATAVRQAADAALPGEVVLLSPACASFDQYSNFAARGAHFQQLVSGLAGGVGG